MKVRTLIQIACLMVAVANAPPLEVASAASAQPATGQKQVARQKMTQAQRQAARAAQPRQKKGVSKQFAGVSAGTKALSPLAAGAPALATMTPLATPDYFGVANWANSPLPYMGPGPVTSIAITAAGQGYLDPQVVITPAAGDTTGSGATATATTAADGSITAIQITNGGSGYSLPPMVTITDANGGPGTGATASVTGFGALNGGIRKFVDTLPGLTPAGKNNLGTYIPLAVPDTTTFPGSDYYRIGLKEFNHQFHSDLPGPCSTAGGITTCGAGAGTDVRGYFDKNNTADPANHYLGPLILATRDRPTRVLFSNELSSDLNLPVDTTYMGAGMISDGVNSAEASTRRATLHLHGGATPWISDGTTMQWITPAGGDGQPAAPGFAKGYSFQNVPDMVGTASSPIPQPALTDGLGTFYWTNQQSGRLMFYHDHAYGITRLNVYDGEAAGYLLIDGAQEEALRGATVPGTITTVIDPVAGQNQVPDLANADLAHLIPLVIQDKTFVPDNGEPGGQLAATDPTWDVTRFGGFGSLWFPHVYMPNQNPADNSGANAFGRWDYGPWFWPPQDPSTFVPQGLPYPCPTAQLPNQYCPGTPNPSGVPEAFMDTPVINGTAYPKLAVTPSAYRFQILAAGNDRSWNLQLYYAVDKNGVICMAGNTFDAASCSEVSMVPAVPHSAKTTPPLCGTASPMPGMGGLVTAVLDGSGNPVNGTGIPANCWPTSWPTDGRDGGVPDPLTAGPPIIQIGTEGGLLPAPAVIPSTPLGYEYNRRSITVLNAYSHGLLLGPAERADVVIDFSTVPAGSVLILYNDSAAPVPAFDPRNDYYTDAPDQSPTGGAPTTLREYGPNIRTLMRITVSGNRDNATSFSLPALAAALPATFAATQDKIIVQEPAYPAANGGAGAPTYVRIQDTSITSFIGGPIGGLTLTGGGSGYGSAPSALIQGGGGSGAGATATITGAVVNGVFLDNGGSGYSSAPSVAFSGGGGTGSAATAAIRRFVGSVNVTNGGYGYSTAPTVTVSGGGGSGATAVASITRGVGSVAVTNRGSGYTSAPAVTFTGGGGSGATAVATVQNGRISGITVSNRGSGYTSAPAVQIAPPPSGTQATATASLTGYVSAVAVVNPGSGYTSVPSVSFSGGGGSGASATATLDGVVSGLTLTSGGAGYTSAPAVTIAGGGGSGALAHATFQPGVVSSITLTSGGDGYTSAPTVAFSPAPVNGTPATAVATPPTFQLQPKAIQELFTLDYGRMNATFGVEIPFTNFQTQTTIPYGYIDPPTELFRDKDIQLWKITHNGVDTHFIHFHLFTVQVVNRVGWDGAIKPPDANELSWKDTVRMNPLEDIIVALRPVKPAVPWDLPNSVRPLDVTMPVGMSMAREFTNVDPGGNPATVVNDLINFGWEYVWHCHLLGHEENDMMRPIMLAVPPKSPGQLTATPSGSGKGQNVTLAWTDNSVNETGFTVERSTDPSFASGVARFKVGANVTSYVDSSVARRTTYYYRVTANNVVGYTRNYAAPAIGYPNLSADSPPSQTVTAATK